MLEHALVRRPGGLGNLRRFARGAWGGGNAFATNCYATSSVAKYLRAQANPGGIHWRRIATSGAAGTTFVTYKDDARGGTLTVGVHNLGLRESDGWHAAPNTAKFRNEPARGAPSPGPTT